MYFYRNKLDSGDYEYLGPFAMPKEMLYEEIAKSERKGKKNTFTEEELEVLMTSTFEHSIYCANSMEINSTTKIRRQLSHYEYRFIYESNKEAMDVSEWLEFLGINQNKHLN